MEIRRDDGRYQFGDVYILGADRLPCPVCGHTTGDCTGAEHRVTPQGATAAGAFPSLQESQSFLVEEDVYEEQQIADGVSMRILRAKAGSKITYKKARRLGLI